MSLTYFLATMFMNAVQVHREQMVWQERKVNRVKSAKLVHLASLEILAQQVLLVPQDSRDTRVVLAHLDRSVPQDNQVLRDRLDSLAPPALPVRPVRAESRELPASKERQAELVQRASRDDRETLGSLDLLDHRERRVTLDSLPELVIEDLMASRVSLVEQVRTTLNLTVNRYSDAVIYIIIR